MKKYVKVENKQISINNLKTTFPYNMSPHSNKKNCILSKPTEPL
jgi:hypothetical protein